MYAVSTPSSSSSFKSNSLYVYITRALERLLLSTVAVVRSGSGGG